MPTLDDVVCHCIVQLCILGTSPARAHDRTEDYLPRRSHNGGVSTSSAKSTVLGERLETVYIGPHAFMLVYSVGNCPVVNLGSCA